MDRRVKYLLKQIITQVRENNNTSKLIYETVYPVHGTNLSRQHKVQYNIRYLKPAFCYEVFFQYVMT